MTFLKNNKILSAVIFLIIFMLLALKFFFIGAGSLTKMNPTPDATFPSLKGISLLGDELMVPGDLKGNHRLLVLGFKRKHQDPINTWLAGFDGSSLKDQGVALYELPVIYEMDRTQRFFLNNAMKFGIPDEQQRDRTITIFLDRSQFLKSMNMDKNAIYAVLIDRSGKILWTQKGVFQPQYIQEIEQILENAGASVGAS